MATISVPSPAGPRWLTFLLVCIAIGSALSDESQDAEDSTAHSPAPSAAAPNDGEEEEQGGTPIYDLANHRWGTRETYTSTFLLIFLGLFGFSIVVAHYTTHVLECTLFPEAAVVLTVGIVASWLAMMTDPDGSVGQELVQFSPTVFFVGLLPPIIFNSGYQVNKRHFFSNFGAIAAFAMVGTLFSTLIIGFSLYGLSVAGALKPTNLELSECLTFGALISATDPVSTLAVFSELAVDPNLFYLVFGESVINDAVGVVLFNTFSKFVGYSHGTGTVLIAIADFVVIFSGSLLIGYLVGCLAGLCSKHTKFEHHHMVEMTAYMLLMYLPYFVAEAVEMSGIVATLFAGITTRHYAHQNLSPESQSQAQFLFKLVAFGAETAVFLDLGLSVFKLDYRDDYYSSLIGWSLLLCLISRALHVYPLSYGLNRSRQEHEGRIEPPQQHMLWFSGLRGAVAFACAQVFPDSNGHREVFLITTMMIVLCTVFTMGCATVPVLKLLHIETGVDEDDYEAPPPSKYTMSFLEFDRRHIMPLLTNDRPSENWVRKEYLRRRAEATASLVADDDMDHDGGDGSGGGGGGGEGHSSADGGEFNDDGVDSGNPLHSQQQQQQQRGVVEMRGGRRQRGAAAAAAEAVVGGGEGRGGSGDFSDERGANDGTSRVSPPLYSPDNNQGCGGAGGGGRRLGEGGGGGYEHPSEEEGGGSEDDLLSGGNNRHVASPEKRPPWGSDGDMDVI